MDSDFDEHLRGRIVKLNRGGLKLCIVYTCFCVLFVGLGHLGDVKARFFFIGLTGAPALALLSWSGLIEFIPVESWMNNVLVLFPLSLVIVYFIGWAFSGVALLLKRLFVRQPPPPVGDDPPGWKPR